MTVNSDLDILIMEQHLRKIKERILDVYPIDITQSGNNVIVGLTLNNNFPDVGRSLGIDNIVLRLQILDCNNRVIRTDTVRLDSFFIVFTADNAETVVIIRDLDYSEVCELRFSVTSYNDVDF